MTKHPKFFKNLQNCQFCYGSERNSVTIQYEQSQNAMQCCMQTIPLMLKDRHMIIAYISSL